MLFYFGQGCGSANQFRVAAGGQGSFSPLQRTLVDCAHRWMAPVCVIPMLRRFLREALIFFLDRLLDKGRERWLFRMAAGQGRKADMLSGSQQLGCILAITFGQFLLRQ
jgi:hypothetical protein